MDEVVIRVLFFAKARELVKKDYDSISVSSVEANISGKKLLNIILEKFSALQPISGNIVLAVDEEYIEPGQLLDLKNCSEIAIIPPLSGG